MDGFAKLINFKFVLLTSLFLSDHSAPTKAHIPLNGVEKWNTSEIKDAISSFRIDNSLKSKIQNNNGADNFTEEAIQIIRDSVCMKNNENLQSFMIMLKKALNKDLLHHTENTQFQFEKLLTLLNIFTILNDAAKVGASVGTMIDEIINILETPLFPSMLHSYKEIATEQSTPCLSKCAIKLSKDINLEDGIGLNVVPISKSHPNDVTSDKYEMKNDLAKNNETERIPQNFSHPWLNKTQF